MQTLERIKSRRAERERKIRAKIDEFRAQLRTSIESDLRQKRAAKLLKNK